VLLPCGVFISFVGPGNNGVPLPADSAKRWLLILAFGSASAVAFVTQNCRRHRPY